NRALTVVTSDDSARQLQTVAYTDVTGISYSVGRDPLWRSDDGPVPVLRRGGMLRKFGLSSARHWIVLRTDSDTFVVLQVNAASEPALVSLLEGHTGVRSQQLNGSVSKE